MDFHVPHDAVLITGAVWCFFAGMLAVVTWQRLRDWYLDWREGGSTADLDAELETAAGEGTGEITRVGVPAELAGPVPAVPAPALAADTTALMAAHLSPQALAGEPSASGDAGWDLDYPGPAPGGGPAGTGPYYDDDDYDDDDVQVCGELAVRAFVPDFGRPAEVVRERETIRERETVRYDQDGRGYQSFLMPAAAAAEQPALPAAAEPVLDRAQSVLGPSSHWNASDDWEYLAMVAKSELAGAGTGAGGA